jgi:hypothetical protein
VFRPGGREDDVVAAEVEVNQAITADRVGDTGFELGKTFEMARRPGVEAADRVIDELLPMPEQAGMRLHA